MNYSADNFSQQIKRFQNQLELARTLLLDAQDLYNEQMVDVKEWLDWLNDRCEELEKRLEEVKKQ